MDRFLAEHGAEDCGGRVFVHADESDGGSWFAEIEGAGCGGGT